MEKETKCKKMKHLYVRFKYNYRLQCKTMMDGADKIDF